MSGKSAVLSNDGLYRYTLTREIFQAPEDDKPILNRRVLYIGVNPSTADHENDDRTVLKWTEFTKILGCNGFDVVNLFAYRATDVKKLSTTQDPVGELNDFWIERCIREAGLIVPCWGNKNKIPRRLRGRIKQVNDLISASKSPAKCFGYTKSGDPKHPLMLPYSTPIISYYE